MATIIQVSKIQLRRGPQQDLPGAPSSLSPITLKPGLDVAEMAFSTDTQRIFIGSNPTQGNPNYQRITFPYQNIEVLTEYSTTINQSLFDAHAQDMQTAYFTSLLLASTATTGLTAVPLVDPTNTVASVPFVINLSAAGGANARIEYFLFDETNSLATPLRAGTLTVSSSPYSLATLTDEYTTSLPQTASGDPASVYGGISFGVGTVTAGITLQYQNLTSYNPVLLFRVERAIPISPSS